MNARIRDAPSRLAQHVAHHRPDHVPNEGALAFLGRDPGMSVRNRPPVTLHDRDFDQLLEFQQACAEPVVNVVIVVGDVVGNRGDLCFEAWPGRQLQVPLSVRFGHGPAWRSDRAIVLGKALERFPTEVETVEIGIWRLQTGCDPERVRIVIEAAAVGQRGAQRPLAGVAERRMAEVVRQAQGLGQVLVEPERARQGSPNLRNFQAVS